jgi:FemAB-related protein (PEP-CTERM system-associated)
VFHSSVWARITAQAYDTRACYVLARRDGRLCGILPLIACANGFAGTGLIALPFAGTQPTVCADDTDTGLALVEHAVTHARSSGLRVVELRESAPQPWPYASTSTYVNILLPLAPDPELVWCERVDSRVRTKVRAARERGLTSRWAGVEALDEFHAIYLDTMHRLGSPPHARRLFEAICAHLPHAVRLLFIMDGARAIATAFVMRDARWIGFPWAASRADAFAKHPNNLLYWTLIEDACAAGYAALDLGRSPRASGTAHFKLQWGGVATPLWYYFALAKRPPRRDASDRSMMVASALWRCLPRSAADAWGPWFARRLP